MPSLPSKEPHLDRPSWTGLFFCLAPGLHDAVRLPALPSGDHPRGRAVSPEVTQPLSRGFARPWGRALHTKYLLVKIEAVDFREDPTNAAISTTDQNPECVKLLEQTQAAEETEHQGREVCFKGQTTASQSWAGRPAALLTADPQTARGESETRCAPAAPTGGHGHRERRPPSLAPTPLRRRPHHSEALGCSKRPTRDLSSGPPCAPLTPAPSPPGAPPGPPAPHWQRPSAHSPAFCWVALSTFWLQGPQRG